LFSDIALGVRVPFLLIYTCA